MFKLIVLSRVFYTNALKNFANKFRRSGDQSVDWFLKKFPEYGDVGKYNIIHYILEAEKQCRFLEGVKEPHQDWYWYLYREMSKYPKGGTEPLEFLDNKISFITFNYD